MVVTACLLLAAASCGDDGDDSANPGSPTTTAPATTTTLTQEEQDEEALRQLAEDWDETNHAIHLRDESVDAAERYLAGDYLENYRQDVQAFLDRGQVVEPDEQTGTTVEIVVVEGDRGEVIECLVDADLLVDADGNVVNDDVSATRLRTEAERSDGEWRFIARSTVEIFEGDVQCASD